MVPGPMYPTQRASDTYMGGVDAFDSRRNTYSSSHKKKVVATAILHLLDTEVTNANIL